MDWNREEALVTGLGLGYHLPIWVSQKRNIYSVRSVNLLAGGGAC